MKIGNFEIDEGHPCFVIAEAGVNHNGQIEKALALVEAAKQSGAHAVKFQTYVTEKIVTKSAPKASYQKKQTDPSESQFDMLKKLELNSDQFYLIKKKCKESGILFLSSPFDETSVDLLLELGVEAIKIPSGEITNIPLISKIAKSGKPIILSTGMSYIEEIEEAVQTIRNNSSSHFSLLHCVSSYPANPKDSNLRAMATLKKSFNVPVGLSDHTKGVEIALAAVALGASIIEKHLTLDHALPGPDHKASLNLNQFKNLVEGIQSVEMALGNGQKKPTQNERNTQQVARKSLVSSQKISKGTTLSKEHLVIKRPGTGIPPNQLESVVGKKTKAEIPNDCVLTSEMFE